MTAKLRELTALVFCLILGLGHSVLHAQEKTANYIAANGNVTNRLQITVIRDSYGSYGLKGYFEVAIKQPDGTTKTRRIPVTGTVSTDGVPASITIPSSTIGVPDLTLGCFFDGKLNLQLVGDERRAYPRLMHLVHGGEEGKQK